MDRGQTPHFTVGLCGDDGTVRGEYMMYFGVE